MTITSMRKLGDSEAASEGISCGELVEAKGTSIFEAPGCTIWPAALGTNLEGDSD